MEQPEQTEASADKTSSENTNAGKHAPQKSKAAPTPPTSMGPPLLLPERQKWWQRGKFWAIVLLFVILAAGGAYAYHLHTADTAAGQKAADTNKKSSSSSQAKPATASLLQTPEALADLHFFKDLGYFGTTCGNNPNVTDPSKCTTPILAEKDIRYYKVGTTASGQDIIDVYNSNQQIGVAFTEYVALRTSPNHYTILANESNSSISKQNYGDENYQSILNDFKAALNPNVTLDTNTTIKELDFPKSVTIKGATLTAAWSTYDYTAPHTGNIMPNGLTDIRQGVLTQASSAQPVFFDSAQGINFYEVTAEDNADYQVKEIYGTINKVFSEQYIVDDPLMGTNDTSSGNIAPLKATWTIGNNTSAAYESAAPGCGSAYGYMVPKDVTVHDLTRVGTGPQGEVLYELPVTSALYKKYFSDYQGGSQYLQDKSVQGYDSTTFQADHGIIIAKNPLGELTVYQRADMFVRGGCGKPVLYLYPQKTTNVNVQVGADVVKSDPKYTTHGWQNVTAHSNGSLQYDGKTYGSLYWEGFGDGPYPLLGKAGTVVPHAKVVSTIRTQLKEQGFDTKEISDFLDFWQPKLPTTPYIRLTWLNTAQMNRLAPLNISPRPDTLIRTFLDFEGLQTPERLQTQTFVAPARQGFTAVEWGGLLRDDSIQR